MLHQDLEQGQGSNENECSSTTRRTSSYSGLFSLLLVVVLLEHVSTSWAQSDQTQLHFLNEDSVILITGAAGFLGSELALALFRTYSPKRILCVDRMGVHRTQEELALFEFQRQRAFHVLQTLSSHATFYRVDLRPMMPEFFDNGEVPALDHIFRENPDISHVVHLADPFPHAALQVVPREKDVPKAGMMEALLEQLVKVKRETGKVPHFTYASSYEVYPYANNATLNPLKETQAITTPSSLRGASKLIDEILAKLYYDQHGIYSVGLRFFPVYGPWSVPGSPLFEMAERAVTGDSSLWDPHWNSIHDYVYIDDAIDAMMSAMQFRPIGAQPPPVVINVASGQGASLKQIAKLMEEYLPRGNANGSEKGDFRQEDKKPTVAYGSIDRAEKFLGYKPRVSLRDGIVKLLAWHYDRAYPYGGRQDLDNEKSNFIASRGIVSCLPNDKECLKATPVFPCASECSHEAQCTGSFYDEIVGWTQSLTSKCDTVLYTVDLDDALVSIPSAHIKIKMSSQSFVDGTCNLAFVSENSQLVRNLRNSNLMKGFLWSGRSKELKNGEWILIPLNVPSIATGDEDILKLLPKLSPGFFFGPRTKRAIYCDPDILFDSIPKLLREASMHPYSEEMESATAMLIGKGKPQTYFAQEDDDYKPRVQKMDSIKSVVQNAAYRMVRIAVSDKLFGDGFTELLDSRWMVHTLQSDDSRLFRCDVFGEVVQWEVETDRSALEFVLGLHDMWSRVISTESGVGPWWIGESVLTVAEGKDAARRRLQEEDAELVNEESDAADGEDADEEQDTLEENEAVDDDATTQKDDGDTNEDTGNGGFGSHGEDQEVNTAGDKKRGGSSDQDRDDDQVVELDEVETLDENNALLERDFSSYDAWMGVLSASSVKYFVRIVPSSEVGVVSLDEYNKESI